MRKLLTLACFSTIGAFALYSCASKEDKKEAVEAKEVKLKEENINYKIDGQADSLNFDALIVFDENSDSVRPGVVVVHEWWGLNEYAKMRARELAKLGYVAMAMDMYGNKQIGENPEAAGKLATPFYQNPQLAKQRIDAAIAKLKAYSQTNQQKIAVIGYCFGGAMALSAAKLGAAFNGAVSFHGNLNVVPADKNSLQAAILVCHGAADPFVPQAEVDGFKKQMDSIAADYTFKSYPDAVHAFTNPNATAMGEKFNIPIKYNAAADSASWKDMNIFFDRIFR